MSRRISILVVLGGLSLFAYLILYRPLSKDNAHIASFIRLVTRPARQWTTFRSLQSKISQAYIRDARNIISENTEPLHGLVREIQAEYDKEVQSGEVPPSQNTLQGQESSLHQLFDLLDEMKKKWDSLRPPAPLLKIHNQYSNALFKYAGFLASHSGRVDGEAKLAETAPKEEYRSHSAELGRQAARSFELALMEEERVQRFFAASLYGMTKNIVATQEEENVLYPIAKRYDFDRRIWPFYNCYADKITDIAEDATSYTLESFNIQSNNEQERRKVYVTALLTYTYIAEVYGTKAIGSADAFKPLHKAVFIVQVAKYGSPTGQSIEALAQAFEELIPVWKKQSGITSEDNKTSPLDTVLGKTVYGLAKDVGKASDINLLVHVEDYWEGKLRDLEAAQNQCLSELGVLHGSD